MCYSPDLDRWYPINSSPDVLGALAKLERDDLRGALERAEVRLEAMQAEIDRLTAVINRPHIGMWTDEVVLEAAHQRERWQGDDATKTPEQWFWLVGYLAGKALAASRGGDMKKARHHTVSTAAVLAHWAAFAMGEETVFSPGTTPTRLGKAWIAREKAEDAERAQKENG